MHDTPARATIEVERADQAKRRIALEAEVFRIGRSTDSDLHVPEAHISKRHAEIRREGASHVLHDVGSRAGVLVNGTPVQRHLLMPGDVVELGASSPVRIVFQLAATRGISALEMTLTGAVREPDRSGMGRLARFFEFSRKLGGGFSLDEVLQDVVDLAIEVTGAERGMLILGRPDGGFDMRLARDAKGVSLPLDRLRISETLVRNAFESGRASVIADVNNQADLALAESVVLLELRSAVTLPLLRFVASNDTETARSVVFGLLYLDSKRQRGSFDGFDMRLLERLAQDASSVIENARLLGEAEQKRRMDREVQMAREVQEALMPEQFTSTPTFAIAGTYVPCHELGGDYVDQFDLGGGRQALVIADVCGKGIAASLLAATLQGALAAEIGNRDPLADIVARVNRVHCRLAPIGKFITMTVTVLEPDGVVRIVNAGHCPAMHVRQGGIDLIGSNGMALGLDDETTYDQTTITLAKGESLVLYTDGVIECEGPGRDLFGEQRLMALLGGTSTGTPTERIEGLRAALDRFRGETPVSDDLTVLVVQRR